MPEATQATVVSAIKTAFDLVIAGKIGKNPDAGWVQKDSMDAIDAVVAADVEQAVAEKQDMAKYSLSVEATAYINKVVNPSAFRLVLERTKRNTPVAGCAFYLRKAPEGQTRSASFQVAGL